MALIITGVSCKHYQEHGGCKFCNYHLMKKTDIESMDIETAIDNEIQKSKESKRYFKLFNGGSFLNDELSVDFKLRILERLKQNGVQHLRFENRFDYIDWDFLKIIQTYIPKITISWGFENSNEKMREWINKVIPSNEEILKILKQTKEMGINNLLYVMAGLPPYPGYNKTYMEDFKDTIDWCLDNKNLIDEVNTLAYTPAKGSEFYGTLWLNNNLRVISKEEWAECKQYMKDKLEGNIPYFSSFLQFWVYSQGKTRNQMNNRKKIK